MAFFDEYDPLVNFEEGRVEAIEKVTGKGKYSADYEMNGLCYGVLVGSTIAAGTISRLKLDDAKQSSGLIDIISYWNKPEVPGLADEAKMKDARIALALFHTDKIFFKGQPIALVVAETYEEAVYAASLVSADYVKGDLNIDFDAARKNIELKVTGKDRGNIETAESAFRLDQEYRIAAEVHNPMEMHATIAHWTAEDKLKLFDKSQGVNGVQRTMGKLFNIPAANISVNSEFVGGGFGSGLRVWSNTIAAAMAAKMVKRPVKLMLTRPQMFLLVGYRPESWQRIKMGMDAKGKISFVQHQAMHSTSVYETFNEGITRVTRLIYDIKNLKTESAVVPLNLGTPTYMRGPGDCTGDFAVETALDELSYQLKMDPVELRLANISKEKDPDTGKPWSTNFLDECVKRGAEKIGWKNRKPNPGMHKEGDWRIGYGMAVGMWTAGRNNASASIEMKKDGSVVVRTAMTDIGTGTGTSMQNIVFTETGISLNKISVELGNSDLPASPSQGGSTGLSSISGAVAAAAKLLKQKLAEQAAKQNDAFKTAQATDIVLSDKGISYKAADKEFISYQELWEKNNLNTILAEASSGPGEERQKYSFCSGAAHYCIVRVHTKTGKVKIDKMVAVVDGGKIVSPKPAANQISGAAVGGIGMALMEEQGFDLRSGSVISNDLAGYHFAVNADAPIIDVSFIDKPDVNINPSGAKGLGEVGIIGVAAAIGNAIYHATGKRFRDLPIKPERLVD